MFTRDNLLWTWSMIASAIVGLAGHFDLFPWIPTAWQRGISLAAFVISTMSAKAGWSWLPASPETSRKHLADTVAAAAGSPPRPVTVVDTQTQAAIVTVAPTKEQP